MHRCSGEPGGLCPVIRVHRLEDGDCGFRLSLRKQLPDRHPHVGGSALRQPKGRPSTVAHHGELAEARKAQEATAAVYHRIGRAAGGLAREDRPKLPMRCAVS